MTELQALRARTLTLFEDVQAVRTVAYRRETMRRILPHLPDFVDGLEGALAHAADVQRAVNAGSYWSEADAVVDLRLAGLRLECQMRLITAAISLAERTLTLRDRQLQLAVQHATLRVTFADVVAERLHAIRLARVRRDTEAAEADAARVEARAHLADLLKALRFTEPPAAGDTETLEDKIATGSATPEELNRYRRRA